MLLQAFGMYNTLFPAQPPQVTAHPFSLICSVACLCLPPHAEYLRALPDLQQQAAAAAAAATPGAKPTAAAAASSDEEMADAEAANGEAASTEKKKKKDKKENKEKVGVFRIGGLLRGREGDCMCVLVAGCVPWSCMQAVCQESAVCFLYLC